MDEARYHNDTKYHMTLITIVSVVISCSGRVSDWEWVGVRIRFD